MQTEIAELTEKISDLNTRLMIRLLVIKSNCNHLLVVFYQIRFQK